jgi:TolA-binding protein
MNEKLKFVCESLDDLRTLILKASSDNRTMTEMWGWSFPPLSRHDLANLAGNLSDKIKANDIEIVSEDISEQLDEIPERIKVFKNNTLQYLFNGHGQHATPSYISLIEWISATLEPLFGWQLLQDNKALPNQLTRRLRSIQSELTELVPKKEELQSQIKLIQNATEAAETLPTDLESLKEARGKVNKISLEAAELFGKIDSYFKNVEANSKLISVKKEEADKLVAQCEEAYKITTTKGLASAFDQRANRLSNSMWVWVFGLMIALFAGVYIGSHRFEVLNTAMNEQKNVGYIWIQIFLSILSLGAPIWFAWISTKQISQRFKLAEDYAFKASVAKAYEGYRKEAARIDEDLETRLFASALTRLEEAPLRLMETEHYGSPWHELITSSQFKNAVDLLPELKDRFLSISRKNVGKSYGNGTLIDNKEE